MVPRMLKCVFQQIVDLFFDFYLICSSAEFSQRHEQEWDDLALGYFIGCFRRSKENPMSFVRVFAGVLILIATYIVWKWFDDDKDPDNEEE